MNRDAKSLEATVELLWSIKRSAPFARHVVRTSDGESFRLSRPDWMLIDPRGKLFACYDDRKRPHCLNVGQIVSIEPAKPRKTSKGDAPAE